MLTADQVGGPRLGGRERRAARDGLGDVAVPRGVQVGVVAVVLDVDAVATNLQGLAVQRLAYITGELWLSCRVNILTRLRTHPLCSDVPLMSLLT